MTTSTNSASLLLAQAGICLAEIIDSPFLDSSAMASDCLEVFDTYEWMAKSDLSETDAIHWAKLLHKGKEGKLGIEELPYFFELTSPEGQANVYYHVVQAKKLVNSIKERELDANTASVVVDEKKPTKFTLNDSSERQEDAINGYIDNQINHGIALHFNGYSDCCSTDENGTPVYIELYENDLRVTIYADINQEDPTHTISLEGARIEKRLEG